jgi:hypothetical protein
MSTWDNYRTDHLILLVGKNPLPNLVAAELLLKPGGIIYLIHSQDTALVAERLQRYFRDRDYTAQLPPSVSEGDAQDIKRKVGDLVSEMSERVGLHYTGGTKAIAVHAYRAVEHEHPNAIFSYLNANTFEMQIDHPPWHDKVLLQVSPKLGDLLNLHGAFFQKGLPKSKDDIVMLQTAQALAQAAPHGGLCEWRNWCDRELRQKAYTGSGWRNKSELQSITLAWPSSACLADAAQSLRQELSLSGGALPLDPTKIPGWPFRKRDPTRLCKWLDGDWLEHYVLDSVVSVGDQLKLHGCVMNLCTDRDKSDFDLELDVTAMRGYQLFGISCTTSVDKHLVKSKLFEAYVRVRQLGGDEARVGLVGGWNHPDKFEREVTRDWDAEGKIRVLGPQHLPDLANHLAQWFETAS